MRLTVGTHNLLDGAGRATPFADLILFTEANGPAVLRQIGHLYHVRTCPLQMDLVVARRKSLDAQVDRARYIRVHDGIAGVTPRRGTWVLKMRIGTHRVKVLVEHRINAAFPPYRRGEAALRADLWRNHQLVNGGIIRRALANDWDVIAGGDVNTPPAVLGYPAALGLSEVRKGLDRIATTGRIPTQSVSVLGNVGSDHPRLRCEVIL